MRRIYKYPLVGFDTILRLPTGARFLSAQYLEAEQTICIWALVNPNALPVDRRVVACSTGHELQQAVWNYQFIDTIQVNAIVWHVFIEPERSFIDVLDNVI